jgi:ABC-type spermidine/putrescine transport system permease subunit I
MGGQHDIMIAMLIDRALEVAIDWPSAALMSLTLLVVTLLLYALYYRITDIRRLIGAR